MGHAERGAGNQPLLRRAAVGRSDQTPAGPLAWSLQQLHRLAWRDKQTAAIRGSLTEHYELGARVRRFRFCLSCKCINICLFSPPADMEQHQLPLESHFWQI